MAFIYEPPNKFGYKDFLEEGNPEKVIKGSEFDEVFLNIQNASEEVSGALAQEIAARIAGDAHLQKQINDILLNGGGGGEGGDNNVTYVRWEDVKEKPPSIVSLGKQNLIYCGTYN
jgi:hypothetical protein